MTGFLFGILVFVAPAAGETRMALVIGNANYDAKLGALANPANDANAVAQALRQVGFDVDLQTNLDQKTMKRAISRFGERMSAAGPHVVGLFYYAGHGLQVNGENYLVPIGADIQMESDADIEGIKANSVLAQMGDAVDSVDIVILDACRNTPVLRKFRGTNRGLAPVRAPNGAYLVYSTAPGEVAMDGAGGHSPFASAFIAQLKVPGESIGDLFTDVRRQVLSATRQQQTPWTDSSLRGDFYFVPSKESSSAKKPASQPMPAAATVDPRQLELALWDSVSGSNDPPQLQSYLDQYPNGSFSAAARAKIASTKKPATVASTGGGGTSALIELELWKSISSSNDASQIQSYLDQYPNGSFSGAAKAKIAALKRPTVAGLVKPTLAAPTSPFDGANLAAEVRRAVEMAYKTDAKARKKAADGQRAQKMAQDSAMEATEIPMIVTESGKYRFNNSLMGWEYAGDYNCSNAQMCGYGVMTWKNGDRFEGEWSGGLMVGVGVYSYPNGDRYEGAWDDSLFGKPKKVIGVNFFADGNPIKEQSGQFEDNKLSGYGVTVYRDGTVVAGAWKKGKLTGYAAKSKEPGTVLEQGTYDADSLKTAANP